MFAGSCFLPTTVTMIDLLFAGRSRSDADTRTFAPTGTLGDEVEVMAVIPPWPPPPPPVTSSQPSSPPPGLSALGFLALGLSLRLLLSLSAALSAALSGAFLQGIARSRERFNTGT